MATVNLLDFVSANDNRTMAERFEAYRAAKRDAEIERRAKFADFGIPRGHTCPASLMFHRDSRFSPQTELPLSNKEAAALARTPDYKGYPDAVSISLPSGLAPLDVTLEDAIRNRRSRKQFSGSPMSLQELSRLLELGAGVTQYGEIARRAAPSAGALFPVEIYPLVFAVDGVDKGLYHYAALTNTLEFLKPLVSSREIWPVLDYSFEGTTPAVAFALTARLPRVQAKYGERGYRFALMEAGHIAQNMLLTATALSLNSVPAGGFFDDGLNFLIGADGQEEVAVYLVLTGKPEL